MTAMIHYTLMVVLLTSPLFAAPPPADAEKLWSLEKSYWQYVQANDLQKISHPVAHRFSRLAIR